MGSAKKSNKSLVWALREPKAKNPLIWIRAQMISGFSKFVERKQPCCITRKSIGSVMR